MTVTANPRAAYLANIVNQASPLKRLIMLMDRLSLDIERGGRAANAKDREESKRQFSHAQEIVQELQSTLRSDVWDGAKDLRDLYHYLYMRLAVAGINSDLRAARDALVVAKGLTATWRRVAVALGEDI